MSLGLPYDSDAGRAWAATLTALMCGHAYRTSAELAAVKGPFAGYPPNRDAMLRVVQKHRAATADIEEKLVPREVFEAARRAWDEALELGTALGYRNSQATVLAPTGTIGLMMDCDTTGIEPDLGLVKTKKLVGGGSMSIVNRTVPQALARLGYSPEETDVIVAYVDEHKTILDAPGLREEDLPVFACAMGDNAIHYMGHVRMMSAAQPFISGAISKTVNMPEEVTVEDVERLYYDAWKMGLKAIALYRDNCKVAQPLSISKKKDARPAERAAVEPAPRGMVRRRLPKARPSQTISFRVGDAKGYLTAGEYPEDGLGEIFVKLGKQGSTLSGLIDAFAISVSLGLQYGVPLKAYVSKFMNMRFDPAGMTDDEEIRFAHSIIDYLARKLAIEYLPAGERRDLGILTVAERKAALEGDGHEPGEADLLQAPAAVAMAASVSAPTDADAPLCFSCGIKMKRAGGCHVCESCGSTSGCS
jgi:ribonucleoside-diphosphate reductase alpha chain